MTLNKQALEGKAALVTGGASRIGKAIALALAERGVSVVVHYLGSARECEKTLASIRRLGVKAWKVKADLSSPEKAALLIQKALRLSGGIDFLINNAAVFEASDISSFSAKELYRVLAVNALSPLMLTRALYRHASKGSVVNILDCRIEEYDLRRASYQLSKNMLRDLTCMTAIRYAPRLRVNAVAPGAILPPRGKGTSYLKKTLYRNLLERSGTAEAIAQAVLFLLENPFITGEILFVDGGEHVKWKNYEKRKSF